MTTSFETLNFLRRLYWWTIKSFFIGINAQQIEVQI